MKTFPAIFCALALMAPSVLRAAGGPDDIIGIWHTAEDKSRVQIYKKADKYYGKIISLKEPNWPADDEDAGKPKNDRRNPDASLRKRGIVGIEFMTDFKHDGKNVWSSGRVYDPESGKTYSGKLTLTNPKQLDLRGYVGISLFGRTETWTKE